MKGKKLSSFFSSQARVACVLLPTYKKNTRLEEPWSRRKGLTIFLCPSFRELDKFVLKEEGGGEKSSPFSLHSHKFYPLILKQDARARVRQLNVLSSTALRG